MTNIPITILANLCGDCTKSVSCKTGNIVKLEGGGVSCADYSPNLKDYPSIKDDHIAALPDREPCSECACRKGTQANTTPHTQAVFKACVDTKSPFQCHGKGGSNRICAGWLHAVKRPLTPIIEGGTFGENWKYGDVK